MKSVEEAAELSVARGCGFAALAIVTVMIGLSDNLSNAMKAGGTLSLGMAAVLYVRALAATRISYNRTEVWILLAKTERPHASIAQQVVGRALRSSYLRYALTTACFAACCLSGSLIFGFFPPP